MSDRKFLGRLARAMEVIHADISATAWDYQPCRCGRWTRLPLPIDRSTWTCGRLCRLRRLLRVD